MRLHPSMFPAMDLENDNLNAKLGQENRHWFCGGVTAVRLLAERCGRVRNFSQTQWEQVLQTLGSSNKSSLELTLSKAGGLGFGHCPLGNIFCCPSHSRKFYLRAIRRALLGTCLTSTDMVNAQPLKKTIGLGAKCRFNFSLALEQVLNSNQQVPRSARTIQVK